MRFDWKIIAAVTILGIFLGAGALAVSEIRTIRKAGGFNEWVKTVPTVNYRTVRGIWLSESVVAVTVLAMVAHAVWPAVVGELQVDLVYAVFFFCGTIQGLNVGAFIGKRATADPAVIAASAAAATTDVLPLVTTRETTSSESKSGATRDTSSTTTVTPVAAPDGGAVGGPGDLPPRAIQVPVPGPLRKPAASATLTADD